MHLVTTSMPLGAEVSAESLVTAIVGKIVVCDENQSATPKRQVRSTL